MDGIGLGIGVMDGQTGTASTAVHGLVESVAILSRAYVQASDANLPQRVAGLLRIASQPTIGRYQLKDLPAAQRKPTDSWLAVNVVVEDGQKPQSPFVGRKQQ